MILHESLLYCLISMSLNVTLTFMDYLIQNAERQYSRTCKVHGESKGSFLILQPNNTDELLYC